WKLQGSRVAKRRHTSLQSADPRNCARRYHALRHFAAPGISPLAKAGDDVENTNLSRARRAERQLNQLWPHVYRAAKYARCNVVRGLCRRLCVVSLQSWRRLFGAREALSSSWSGDDGLDGDRCERAR